MKGVSGIDEYYAAALVHLARELPAGISQPRSELRGILENRWNLKVTEDDLSNAMRVLNRCDISYSEEDEFAGTFVVITEERFNNFLERVAKEQAEYDKIANDPDDPNLGLSRAEDTYLPYLSAYNTYKVLRKYSAFGAAWLESAVEEIRRREKTGQLGVSVADQVLPIAQDDPRVTEIKSAAEELRTQLISGNDLGTLTPEQARVAAHEIEQLQQSLSKEAVRPSEVSQRARRTLLWVGEKAAGSLVGQAATALFKLIMRFLGIPI